MTQRWKLTIEYDGTPFMGWQRQEHGNTVQQVLEEAYEKMTRETDLRLHVCGRTDAGVHAVGQVAHIDLDERYSEKEVRDAPNYHLGDWPVAILSAEKVSDDFHARFQTKKRDYRYRITCDLPTPPQLDTMRSWHIKNDLDIAAMRAGALHLLGHHDFSSFRAAQCQGKSPVKTVDKIEISEFRDPLRPGRQILIDVRAKSFLHHQVRNFTGLLKEVGEGKRKPGDVKTILEACDRRASGITAPAHGLYFVRAEY
tara:strand:- start:455 stop:1219 length:765 start_codon:yes stop_codon:yes gene_type:complete